MDKMMSGPELMAWMTASSAKSNWLFSGWNIKVAFAPLSDAAS